MVAYRLNCEEIKELLPYELIFKTKRSEKWKTKERLERWQTEFTPYERSKACEIFSKSHSMYFLNHFPLELGMSEKTYALWFKLGEFCASL